MLLTNIKKNPEDVTQYESSVEMDPLSPIASLQLGIVHYLSMHDYFFFFFNDTATTEIYTLSLHDALPIWCAGPSKRSPGRPSASSIRPRPDRKSTRLNSSHMSISYAVFCLKKKNKSQ